MNRQWVNITIVSKACLSIQISSIDLVPRDNYRLKIVFLCSYLRSYNYKSLSYIEELHD